MAENKEPTKAELQKQARKAGVPTSGTKEEIAERLEEAEGADETEAAEPAHSDRLTPTVQPVVAESSQSVVDTANRVVDEGWQSATSGRPD